MLVAERERGNASAIGVSNFSPSMRRAQSRWGGAIINNQVEFHPLIDQTAILAAARELGSALAYSPPARGAALKPPVISEIAARIGRQPSEVTFDLTADDMAAISTIGTRQGRTINPSWMAGRWEP